MPHGRFGYGATVTFEPGQVVTRRYWRGGLCTWVQPMRVIADDADGLLLWSPVGSDVARLVDADGRNPHDLPVDELRDPRLTVGAWERYDVLVLMPPQAAYSVWWFFDDGVFAGWYVNLEEPCVRHPGGVDTTDLVLDLVVSPERRWEWKDADEFAERVGHPLYFDRATADGIRAEGERLIGLVEAAEFPFDGTYTDFRPGPDWPAPRLPRDVEAAVRDR
ncbi:Protein of unknown function (DUF402) [Micromonospora mirobrigensis]|uniref:DUF402 domain-containing protein n=1 Tax=Micromonospora mirobrigensis TaxID=262898 RepID=A0A1C5AMK6_9ACTN|nr:Protein of unknown function (DUF402) [Micromonospora mirobrigensis]